MGSYAALQCKMYCRSLVLARRHLLGTWCCKSSACTLLHLPRLLHAMPCALALCCGRSACATWPRVIVAPRHGPVGQVYC